MSSSFPFSSCEKTNLATPAAASGSGFGFWVWVGKENRNLPPPLTPHPTPDTQENDDESLVEPSLTGFSDVIYRSSPGFYRVRPGFT